MTLIHNTTAAYVVTVDGRSQIWRFDNVTGRAVYCRDVSATESPSEFLTTYRLATAAEHDEIAEAIRAVVPGATVTA